MEEKFFCETGSEFSIGTSMNFMLKNVKKISMSFIVINQTLLP
jgi:hypothetical protein